MRTSYTREPLTTELAGISHANIARYIHEGQQLRAAWLAAFFRSVAGRIRALARQHGVTAAKPTVRLHG